MGGQPQFRAKRALLGLSVEASLVVRVKLPAPLFAAAAGYLAGMKGIAEPIDLAKEDVYKRLQRKMPKGPRRRVIELEAEGASAGDTTITVFGTDRADGRLRATPHSAWSLSACFPSEALDFWLVAAGQAAHN